MGDVCTLERKQKPEARDSNNQYTNLYQQPFMLSQLGMFVRSKAQTKQNPYLARLECLRNSSVPLRLRYATDYKRCM